MAIVATQIVGEANAATRPKGKKTTSATTELAVDAGWNLAEQRLHFAGNSAPAHQVRSGLTPCGCWQAGQLLIAAEVWDGELVRPNVRAKPDPADGRLAGAADDALHGCAGQVPGCWGSA